MTKVLPSMKESTDKLSPSQFAIFLFTIFILGGGFGHLGSEFANSIIGTDISASLDQLNATLENLSRSVNSQSELLNRTRCEVNALREGLDWRDCWTPR